jgi:hypothetical protein
MIKLNLAGYDHAEYLIKNGLEIEYDTHNWEAVKPTRTELVEFLDAHTLEEYGTWFLGINTDADPQSTNKYVYPFGDLKVIHQSALILTAQEAKKNGDTEIFDAAEKLLKMIKSNKK